MRTRGRCSDGSRSSPGEGRWKLPHRCVLATTLRRRSEFQTRPSWNLLVGLVDKSLVVAGEATQGTVRYRMLEPIRQYDREKLKESGDADAVKGGHAAFFLQVAEKAESALNGPQQRL